MNNRNNFSFEASWITFVGTIISAIISLLISFIDLFSGARTALFILCTTILGALISIMIDKYINKIKKVESAKKHFPMSYPIVEDEISQKFIDKSGSENYKGTNNKIDKTIKSPLEYTRETLHGNQAPFFNPNEQYLEEIYNDDLAHIVAITAENPNLWLDPTLCFYMINCCAVSLIRKINSGIITKLRVSDFRNDTTYTEIVTKESKLVLDKLKNKEIFDKFEFIRFFLFDEDQKECLNNTVLPSLKASQDLFRIKSFFIKKDSVKNCLPKSFNEYESCIKTIWDSFISSTNNLNDESKKIIEKRKAKLLPEFLILFKKDENIVIHTYVNGKPYHKEFLKGTASDSFVYEAIRSLTSILSECRLTKGNCDWFPTNNDGTLNKTKSYIDFIEQPCK